MSRRLPFVVLYGGVAALVLGLSKIHATWVAERTYDFSTSTRAVWAVVLVVLLGSSCYAAGLPDLTAGRAKATAWATAGALCVALAGISVAQLVFGSPLLPRFVVAGTALGIVPIVALASAAAGRGRAASARSDRVLMIATEEDGRELESDLAAGAERPAELVAVVDPDDAQPVSGSSRPIEDLVDRLGATVVVMNRESQADQRIVDQVARLHERGIRVRTLSLFYEEWLGKLPLGELERVSLMFDIGELHRRRFGRTKRLMDVVAGVALLPVLAAAAVLVVLGNRVGNAGPLLYTQTRVGKDGHTFRIHKFRTMRHDPGATTDWTADDDERITPFGRILRRTHVDELPQVVDILRGDLSLVGPRPEQPHYVELLREKLPYYNLRHLVRPGLTGWAQVKYGYAGSERDALQKLQYEFFYLRRQGLRLDLRILARTARTVVAGEGSR